MTDVYIRIQYRTSGERSHRCNMQLQSDIGYGEGGFVFSHNVTELYLQDKSSLQNLRSD